MIRHELKPDRVYNLLDSNIFRELAIRPSLIRENLKATDKLIAIDEIQKLPNLMDEVHLMIETFPNTHFLLTGSSARKLKRTHTSLMAGRAKRQLLYPLSAFELKEAFDLKRVLLYGALPPVYLSEDPWDELRSYVGDYLKEEIMAEALSRNIESFARFLQTAAYSNAEILNFEKIGSDAQVPARTIREYYSVLEDTLIGTALEPFRVKNGRKTLSKSKFYFFDLGVLNSLLGRKSLSVKTPEFGNLFETWVFLELQTYLSYQDRIHDEPISYWRTQSNLEVDFIVGNRVGIEVKSTQFAAERDIHGLTALGEEIHLEKKIIVSQDKEVRRLGDTQILPVQEFVDQLWAGELI